MKIKKTYEENRKIGPYEFVRIGVEISSDKEILPSEFEEFSAKLTKLAQEAIDKELEQVKLTRLGG